MQIIEFLHYLILIYVGISVSYLIFFTLIGLYPRKIKKTSQKKTIQICCVYSYLQRRSGYL